MRNTLHEYQVYLHNGERWMLLRESDDRDELDDYAKRNSHDENRVYGIGRKGDAPFRLYDRGVRFIAA